MTYLLDVNVLIALIDSGHTHHDAAHAWFQTVGYQDWATCPLTENGTTRILGSSKYERSPGSPAIVMAIVQQLTEWPGHRFWPDDISLLNARLIIADNIRASQQITDSYLLALAKAHDGVLATFDRKISTDAVIGGRSALHIIGN